MHIYATPLLSTGMTDAEIVEGSRSNEREDQIEKSLTETRHQVFSMQGMHVTSGIVNATSYTVLKMWSYFRFH